MPCKLEAKVAVEMAEIEREESEGQREAGREVGVYQFPLSHRVLDPSGNL